jgi:hypothetical protein
MTLAKLDAAPGDTNALRCTRVRRWREIVQVVETPGGSRSGSCLRQQSQQLGLTELTPAFGESKKATLEAAILETQPTVALAV